MASAILLLRVGFDLDGVLNCHETPCLDWFKARGLVPEEATPDAITHYNFEACFPGVSRRDVAEMFAEGFVFSNAEPNFGGVETLNNLTYSGVETHIITHRPGKYIRQDTARWLKRHEIDYRHLHFVQERGDKSDLCAKLGIDIFIEDNLDTALALTSVVRLSLLLDKPYNQGAGVERYRRFYSWDEVQSLFY